MAYSVSMEVVVDVFLAALSWHRCPCGRISPSSITAKMATEISFTGVGDGDKAGFCRVQKRSWGEVSNDNEAMKPMVTVDNICILTSHR